MYLVRKTASRITQAAGATSASSLESSHRPIARPMTDRIGSPASLMAATSFFSFSHTSLKMTR